MARGWCVHFHKIDVMKMPRFFLPVTLIFASILLDSCGPKDEDVESAVQAVISGSTCVGVSSKVDNGTVTITGDCKDQQGIQLLETQLKQVYGVEKVINNVKVSDPEVTTTEPTTLTISSGDTLTAAVRKIVQEYPSVQAQVNDSVVLLSGEANKSQGERLINQIKALKPKSVDSKKLLIK